VEILHYETGNKKNGQSNKAIKKKFRFNRVSVIVSVMNMNHDYKEPNILGKKGCNDSLSLKLKIKFTSFVYWSRQDKLINRA